MEREEFSHMLRDVLNNIHDFIVLEKHPLNRGIPQGFATPGRTDRLRQWIRAGILSLKPEGEVQNLESLEWRYFLILYNRYIEGMGIADIEKQLMLGDRQLRRLHGRALDALEILLWNQSQPFNEEDSQTDKEAISFLAHFEELDPVRILREVAELCGPRARIKGGELILDIQENLPIIRSDRVILRQIVLDLMNRVLQGVTDQKLMLQAYSQPNGLSISFQPVDAVLTEVPQSQLSGSPVLYWIDQIHSRLATFQAESGAQFLAWRLYIPQVRHSSLLVVDDHEAAIRIIQRFLGQSGVQVVGLTESSRVLEQVRSTRPAAVLLDVMMPGVDGWEILQALKSDPETHSIPVIICSVWDQPDLAYSLGANGFLNKPISQADLMKELNRLHLLDNADGSSLQQT